jgi:hypothetical protein
VVAKIFVPQLCPREYILSAIPESIGCQLPYLPNLKRENRCYEYFIGFVDYYHERYIAIYSGSLSINVNWGYIFEVMIVRHHAFRYRSIFIYHIRIIEPRFFAVEH